MMDIVYKRSARVPRPTSKHLETWREGKLMGMKDRVAIGTTHHITRGPTRQQTSGGYATGKQPLIDKTSRHCREGGRIAENQSSVYALPLRTQLKRVANAMRFALRVLATRRTSPATAGHAGKTERRAFMIRCMHRVVICSISTISHVVYTPEA